MTSLNFNPSTMTHTSSPSDNQILIEPYIHYVITPFSANQHLIHVSCQIQHPNPKGQIVSLPSWIPGSYLIREFSRNITHIHAQNCHGSIPIHKTNKNHWRIMNTTQDTITIDYMIYAYDLSVRSAFFDHHFAFINPAVSCLAVDGQTEHPCTIDICPPKNSDLAIRWQLASSLSVHVSSQSNNGFGRYVAKNYTDLIEHPLLMGELTRSQFEINGVMHQIVLNGDYDCNLPQLTKDVQRICQCHVDLFQQAIPMSHYTFLLIVTEHTFGGLEHTHCSALMAPFINLPYANMQQTVEYQHLLGLFSHEYFHSWHVKRIKPQAFIPYDLNQENYTRQLWIFEGFTSYYEYLALVRSGVINLQDFLDRFAEIIQSVINSPGRLQQSISDASFDAWIKFYRPDENSPNALVSYYTKGAIVACLLDLTLRHLSEHQLSLDTIMQTLWKNYEQQPLGLAEDALFDLIEQQVHLYQPQQAQKIRNVLALWVNQVEELPIAETLAHFSLELNFKPFKADYGLGLRFKPQTQQLIITHVLTGGIAEQSGLSAGDEIIACNGWQVNQANVDKHLQIGLGKKELNLHFFHQGKLCTCKLQLAPPVQHQVQLRQKTNASTAEIHHLQQWLHLSPS